MFNWLTEKNDVIRLYSFSLKLWNSHNISPENGNTNGFHYFMHLYWIDKKKTDWLTFEYLQKKSCLSVNSQFTEDVAW